jgi:hypothetical protein
MIQTDAKQPRSHCWALYSKHCVCLPLTGTGLAPELRPQATANSQPQGSRARTGVVEEAIHLRVAQDRAEVDKQNAAGSIARQPYLLCSRPQVLLVRV